MGKSNNKDGHLWRNIIIRGLLTAVTVAVIVWAMPRDESRLYNYDIGKPWNYNTLIAKFDFPIYKSEATIKAEEDSLLATFLPYYNYDAEVEQNKLQLFHADFAEGIEGVPDEETEMVAERLHSLYQIGIIDKPEYDELRIDTASAVRIVVNNSAQTVLVDSLYSTLSAYEKLLDDTSLLPYRSILQKNNLNRYIEANLTYDELRSENEKDDLLSGIPSASGMVMSGQKIIDQGDIVDEYTCRVISSFERETKRRSASAGEITTTLIGQIIIVTLMMAMFTTFLSLFRRDYFDSSRSIAMLYTIITVFPLAVSLFMRHNFFSVYIIPFAIAPMFVRVFMDSRTAFMAHLTMVIICSCAVKYQFEFTIIQLVSGLVAIYSMRDLIRRAQIFRSALVVTLASAAVFFAIQMMQYNDASTLDYDMYYYFIVNGVLLLLAYPLMFLIEKLFGFTSNITLFELSNTNRGLAHDLSELAPGTFQHSITVGNLAAEVANRIGADSLLVRTGALYHDIGKMANPAFYTENQAGVNPHDDLTYKESARIVIGHVTEGIKMAERAGLPGIIKNFILTHHGAGVAKYFYIKYKNENPNEDVDSSDFAYPGPNPFTLEQAILIMADSVEAASRSLKEYTEESISALVSKIVDSQVADGFFRECPITFRDIEQAKQVMTERLRTIYHTRVSYPELSKRNNTRQHLHRNKRI